eukprot:TRINITY_DN4958_c0_g1_i1.p1 TRINITY_DN4958_c0_g1~~TRINITY_DN4958_c0_g1_i1.p1  ORF type:complete len:69 (-),score=1.56 TRINITY_DN4958_c0_g1_i1:51-257(-)
MHGSQRFICRCDFCGKDELMKETSKEIIEGSGSVSEAVGSKFCQFSALTFMEYIRFLTKKRKRKSKPN